MRTPSGHTEPFAVLGHPAGHSLSPVMHNASFEALDMDAIYLAFDVHPNRLTDVLMAMRDMGFRGANLTVPLKEIAFRDLSNLDESAQLLGAVNTVAFTPDAMVGYNTDGDGFLAAVDEAFGPSIRGETVFVLGAGGVGRTVALVCARQGARRVVVSDVDHARSKQVAREIADAYPDTEAPIAAPTALAETAREADLVVQCTPVGMKESDPSLLGPDAFREGQKVFDLIYMYPETAILRTAREAGAQTGNGLGMLLHQGARSFTIWTKKEASVAAMRAALEKAVYNI